MAVPEHVLNHKSRFDTTKPWARDSVEVVLTWRKAHPRIIEAADLVTEMKEVKHYCRQGVEAKVGIEK